MTFRFSKMHGLGNDFIVIDGINQRIDLSTDQIKNLSRRDTGIGFDQCLLIEKSPTADVDFYYRIFNADGQEVGQCGNGARCLARFIQYQGLSDKKEIRVATPTTIMNLTINPDDSVTVDMGCPLLKPTDIPLSFAIQREWYPIPVDAGDIINLHALGLGNPHAVILVDNIEKAPVETAGHQISVHPLFPEQVNVGFMQIVNPGLIHLRVYERGCGETRACGSGAVAAAAAGRLFHRMNEQIIVTLPGGELTIDWPDTEASIYLTGPASFVYEGKLIY